GDEAERDVERGEARGARGADRRHGAVHTEISCKPRGKLERGLERLPSAVVPGPHGKGGRADDAGELRPSRGSDRGHAPQGRGHRTRYGFGAHSPIPPGDRNREI